jgi:hypothetical protein
MAAVIYYVALAWSLSHRAMRGWGVVTRASGRRAKASVYEVVPPLTATAKGTGNYGYYNPTPFCGTSPRHPLTGPKYGRAYQASFGYQPRGTELASKGRKARVDLMCPAGGNRRATVVF